MQNSEPELVRKNWPILGRNNTTLYIRNKNLISGYRKPKNLRTLLMRAKIPQMEQDLQINPILEPPQNVDIKPADQLAKSKDSQKLITDFIKPIPKLTTNLMRTENICLHAKSGRQKEKTISH